MLLRFYLFIYQCNSRYVCLLQKREKNHKSQINNNVKENGLKRQKGNMSLWDRYMVTLFYYIFGA